MTDSNEEETRKDAQSVLASMSEILQRLENVESVLDRIETTLGKRQGLALTDQTETRVSKLQSTASLTESTREAVSRLEVEVADLESRVKAIELMLSE
ncbi:MAG: hypothetical protein HXY34_11325 [Candidatus Thorarchaeota archaeon]|nr:hypothetical protein [Candidatus Thorarchaeota archaeon]